MTLAPLRVFCPANVADLRALADASVLSIPRIGFVVCDQLRASLELPTTGELDPESAEWAAHVAALAAAAWLTEPGAVVVVDVPAEQVAPWTADDVGQAAAVGARSLKTPVAASDIACFFAVETADDQAVADADVADHDTAEDDVPPELSWYGATELPELLNQVDPRLTSAQ